MITVGIKGPRAMVRLLCFWPTTPVAVVLVMGVPTKLLINIHYFRMYFPCLLAEGVSGREVVSVIPSPQVRFR